MSYGVKWKKDFFLNSLDENEFQVYELEHGDTKILCLCELSHFLILLVKSEEKKMLQRKIETKKLSFCNKV